MKEELPALQVHLLITQLFLDQSAQLRLRPSDVGPQILENLFEISAGDGGELAGRQ